MPITSGGSSERLLAISLVCQPENDARADSSNIEQLRAPLFLTKFVLTWSENAKFQGDFRKKLHAAPFCVLTTRSDDVTVMRVVFGDRRVFQYTH